MAKIYPDSKTMTIESKTSQTSELTSSAEPAGAAEYNLQHLDFAQGSKDEHEVIEMLGNSTDLPPVQYVGKVEAGAELLESLAAIPSKMAFKIGEAAEMVGVKQYVLRYWETEFEALRPRKSKNNQRVYSRRDVETALMIKKLLYEDRFSIEGARAALKQLKTQVKEERGIQVMAQSQETAVTKLRGLLEEIRRLREIF